MKGSDKMLDLNISSLDLSKISANIVNQIKMEKCYKLKYKSLGNYNCNLDSQKLLQRNQ
jgi:hypothetical protein